MKFLFNTAISCWKLTGLVGKNSRWFLGYSKNILTCTPKELADYMNKNPKARISVYEKEIP